MREVNECKGGVLSRSRRGDLREINVCQGRLRNIYWCRNGLRDIEGIKRFRDDL